MTDRDFLIWIHERLRIVHGESDLVDYMHRLRGIIEAMPAGQQTPHVASTNSMAHLQRKLAILDQRRSEGALRRIWRAWVERWYSQLGNEIS